MRQGKQIGVVIPALNEEDAIARVVEEVPGWVDRVVVADNGSSDRTVERARAAGAVVVHEPRRGYGSACLTGVEQLRGFDVIVFLDGDHSDYPGEMDRLVDPLLGGEADLVVGSRVRGSLERGALTPQARFGNRLSCWLIKRFWGVEYTDLGPFRAVTMSAYRRLAMYDPNYGWTMEMQARAAALGLRALEVPVSYRRRIGESKVSGTVKGVVYAGTKILTTVFGEYVKQRSLARRAGRSRERLIVFTRWPEAGTTKTRLRGELGPEGAAQLQRRLTERILDQARTLGRMHPLRIEVRFEGGDPELLRRWLGPDLIHRPQGGGDMGARMERALARALDEGDERVVLVGSDLPELTAGIMQEALDALEAKRLVIGPAADGGYYLMGVHREHRPVLASLFSQISWGSDQVFAATVQAARQAGLDPVRLPTLTDVDRPEDLAVWERAVAPPPDLSQALISVIIPARDEAAAIERSIASARTGEGVEVIVADGGSADRTRELARDAGARVIEAPAGRARQMNAGARSASGEILLFLHADTELPPGYEGEVRRALALPRAVGGAFELAIDDRPPGLRLVERLANWRSRRLLLPYGDQGIFVRADVFHSLGGFPRLEIMEDFELMRRLNRRGRVVIVPAAVRTSARRWRRTGVLRNTVTNQLVILAHLAGRPWIPPQRRLETRKKP